MGLRIGGFEESAGSGGRPWVGIVANANSGRGSGRERVEHLIRELSRRGLGSRVAWTPEDRVALVVEARHDRGCRCLVAAGGDGTVAALVNECPEVPVTVLPAGTENLFARHFGVRRAPGRVAETIAAGRVVPIDLGLAGRRRFTLMAGIGLDADVVTRHHLARIGRAGRMRPTHRAAYVEPVLRAGFGYRFPALTVQVADPGREETLVGSLAFIFNLPRYALGLPIAPTALEDDGWLDLVVFRNAGPLQALRYLWLVFRGIHLDRPGVHHRRVRRVSVSSAAPAPVQLDGDPGGTILPQGSDDHAPWTVEVLPRVLGVVVPQTYPSAAG